jgi:hypothetical protein
MLHLLTNRLSYVLLIAASFETCPTFALQLALQSELKVLEVPQLVGQEELCLQELCSPKVLTKTTDCLGLSKTGFPLPADKMLKEAGNSKRVYFDRIKQLGYDENLEVVAQGKAEIRSKDCLAEHQKQIVAFVGDCMPRQTYEAFLRNSLASTSISVELTEGGKVVERSADGMESEEKVAFLGGDVPGEVNAFYQTWWCTSVDEMLSKLDNNLAFAHSDARVQGNGLVLWMGCSIWAFMVPDATAWGDEGREDQLRNLVTKVRARFPQATLIWDAPSWIDMGIMAADPPKPDMWKFTDRNVTTQQITFAKRDLVISREMGFSVVPRTAISMGYSGLQCDGIHNTPKSGGADAVDWGCPEYPAVEDLVLQAGLAAVCAQPGQGGPDEAICSPH